MAKTIDIHQVDAFTDTIFGGNPAGVVTNADGLTDEQMLKIAREMNLSETAFVLSPSSAAADVRMRYLTPASSEIKFCGHATVGALYELSRLHMHGLGSARRSAIRVETNAGVLPMAVIMDSSNQPKVEYTAPAVTMKDFRLQGRAFADEFGIPVAALLPDGKIRIDTNLNYVYIPVVSLNQLGALRFDFGKIRERFASDDIVVFCLFTNGTFAKTSHVHARGLAPLVGVDEDPFTGSMQAGLVHTAKYNHLIAASGTKIIVEQGNFIGRPGFAEVTYNKAGDVSVAASAVQVFSTTMEV